MFEVTAICSASGTTAHATVTNSITSDNDLMDATIAVAANNIKFNIQLTRSTAQHHLLVLLVDSQLLK